MEFIYPLLTAFCLVFFSELGDKTQLLVLSFSTKLKAATILIGVAIDRRKRAHRKIYFR